MRGKLVVPLCAGAFLVLSGSARPVRAQHATDTVWTIEAGRYAGSRIPLSYNAALGGRGRDRFWRVAAGEGITGGIVGWKSSRYPIPLALRHDRHSRGITAADSSAFWAILNEMDASFGFSLFRPITLGGDDPPDVIVVDVGAMREADGLSRVTWAPSGELFDVRVTFQDPAVLHDAHVVMHEMMHALGFGHTTEWKSVVNSRDASRSARVTPEDVAYSELAMHSRVTRERADTRHLIALLVERESSSSAIDEGDAHCADDLLDPLAGGKPIGMRAFLPVGLLPVVSACDAHIRKFSL